MDNFFICIIIFSIILFIVLLFKQLFTITISSQLHKLDKKEFFFINNNFVSSIYGVFIITKINSNDIFKENNYNKYLLKRLKKSNKKLIHDLRKILLDYPQVLFKTLFVSIDKMQKNISNEELIHVKDLYKKIMEIKGDIILSIDQVYDITYFIKNIYIKRKNNSLRNKGEKICPYCGGNIQLIEGPHCSRGSSLYICSNFPKMCNYNRRYYNTISPYDW